MKLTAHPSVMQYITFQCITFFSFILPCNILHYFITFLLCNLSQCITLDSYSYFVRHIISYNVHLTRFTSLYCIGIPCKERAQKTWLLRGRMICGKSVRDLKAKLTLPDEQLSNCLQFGRPQSLNLKPMQPWAQYGHLSDWGVGGRAHSSLCQAKMTQC